MLVIAESALRVSVKNANYVFDNLLFKKSSTKLHALAEIKKVYPRRFHCVQSVRIRSFSGPYFPTYGLNT